MPANKKLKWQVPFLLVLIVGTVLILRKQAPYQTDQGLVFGTMYKITYQYKENLKEEIEAELQKVDNSLSPFNKKSNYHSHQQQHGQHSRQYVYPCLPVVQINLGRNTRSI